MQSIWFVQLGLMNYIDDQMNSTFSRVSNLKLNRLSKKAITLISSTFLLYAFGQAPFFKYMLIGVFSCSG